MSKKIVKVVSEYNEGRNFDTNYNGEVMRHIHTIYALYEDGTWDKQESVFYTVLGKGDNE